MRSPGLVKQKTWIWVTIAALICSINIVFQHTHLAVVAYCVSMALLASFSLHPNTSFLIAALHSLYSLVGSLLANFFKGAQSRTSKINTGYSLSLKLMVPPMLTIVFFFIYRGANPAFSSLTDELFDGWITAEWMVFTLVGFLLLFSFFYPIAIEEIVRYDIHTADALFRKRSRLKQLFSLLALKTEYQSGWLSFALLNGLLVFVNLTDVYYLLIARSLPEGVIYSEYVHQGVYALIFSIVLAIAVILYYFRGNLNFYRNNHKIKLLAYGWIIQNALLVVAAAAKTSMYVTQYGLTHKRIGVFVYLLLTGIGLFLAFIKIYSVKSNVFLFRKASWAFYVVFITATFINWNRLITYYNTSRFSSFREIDINYLIQLPDANIGQLTDFMQTSPEKLTEDQQWKITRKKDLFVARIQGTDWQSWNYDDMQLAKDMQLTEPVQP
jgi:hypothetical protein